MRAKPTAISTELAWTGGYEAQYSIEQQQVTGSRTLVGTVHKPPAPALEPVPSPALLERDLVSVTACGPCASLRRRGWAARAPSAGGGS